MEEIKVGEYVRTKKGTIDIFKEKDENGLFARCEKNTYWIPDIVKHSKHIIDVIEIGDYVNGHRIIMDLKQSRKHYGTADCFVTAKGYTFEKNEIETILTKEQYMQNCYKLDLK